MPLNRVVALLTPLFALAAGAVASWLAENFPGVDISASDLQAIFIAGAVAVLAPALHWLNGWQKYEVREEAARVAAVARDDAGAATDDLDDEDDDGFDLDGAFGDDADFDEDIERELDGAFEPAGAQ